MDCEKCVENLTAYLDGELSPGQAEKTRAHLIDCRQCADELQSLTVSAGFVASHAKEISLKPEIWNQVRSRISAVDVTTRSVGFLPLWLWDRWWRTASALAATAALTLGFWGYLRYAESQSSLRAYMDEYVSARNAQEQMQRAPGVAASGDVDEAESARQVKFDNPFAETDEDSYNNPFHTED
jgi:anti-sigma factor RsiW